MNGYQPSQHVFFHSTDGNWYLGIVMENNSFQSSETNEWITDIDIEIHDDNWSHNIIGTRIHDAKNIRPAEAWEILGTNKLLHIARYNYGAKVHGNSAPNKYDVEFPNFRLMGDFVATYELQERTIILPQYINKDYEYGPHVNHYRKFNESVVVSIDLTPKGND